MKKMRLVVIASLAFALCAWGATAGLAAPAGNACGMGAGKRAAQACLAQRAACNPGAWVDADGDGVCDNRTSNNAYCQEKGVNWLDENADGVCDNAGSSCGTTWLDENGDGVCDNAGDGGSYGAGAGKGQGQGRGAGGFGHGKNR